MSASSADPAMQARITDERTAADAHTAVAFSRPVSCPLSGKQSCVLKTSVTDEIADDFVRLARDKGYASTSDALRDRVIVALRGPDYLADLHRQRIHSLAQNLNGNGTGPAR